MYGATDPVTCATEVLFSLFFFRPVIVELASNIGGKVNDPKGVDPEPSVAEGLARN